MHEFLLFYCHTELSGTLSSLCENGEKFWRPIAVKLTSKQTDDLFMIINQLSPRENGSFHHLLFGLI